MRRHSSPVTKGRSDLRRLYSSRSSARVVVDTDGVDQLLIGHIAGVALHGIFQIQQLAAVHVQRRLVIYARGIELIAEVVLPLEIVLPVVVNTLRLQTSVRSNEAVEEVIVPVQKLFEAAAAEAAGEGTEIAFCIAVAGNAGAADPVRQHACCVEDFFRQMAAVVSEYLVVFGLRLPFLCKGIQMRGVKESLGIHLDRLQFVSFDFHVALWAFENYQECTMASRPQAA